MKMKLKYSKLLLICMLLQQATISQTMFERSPNIPSLPSFCDESLNQSHDYIQDYLNASRSAKTYLSRSQLNASNISMTLSSSQRLNRAASKCDLLLMAELIKDGAEIDDQTLNISMEALEKKKDRLLWPCVVTSEEDTTQEQRIERVRGHIKSLLNGGNSPLFGYVKNRK